MGLVFVHGIGNRDSPAYAGRLALRDALFRRYLLARALPTLDGTPIHNPMWGELGASLAWNHASLPAGRRERLGGADSFVADLLAAVDPDRTGRPLVHLARRDVRDAVDLLYSVADLRGRSVAEIEDLADLAIELTDRFDADGGGPGTWPDDGDDLDVVEALTRPRVVARSSGATETLGGVAPVRTAARAVLAAAVDGYRRRNIGPPSRYAAAGLRRLAARPISLLIGDVMAYLGRRGTPAEPGPIVTLVADALDAAAKDGPLVVVAHSMGGNITYDILSHFRPGIEVDTFVTVGSQVGLFEELKLLGASDARIPSAAVPRVPALPNVRHWINVVDRADMLAYQAAGVFHGVVDYDYPTDAPWAHGAYFRQPNFHARLAARVQEARR